MLNICLSRLSRNATYHSKGFFKFLDCTHRDHLVGVLLSVCIGHQWDEMSTVLVYTSLLSLRVSRWDKGILGKLHWWSYLPRSDTLSFCQRSCCTPITQSPLSTRTALSAQVKLLPVVSFFNPLYFTPQILFLAWIISKQNLNLPFCLRTGRTRAQNVRESVCIASFSCSKEKKWRSWILGFVC